MVESDFILSISHIFFKLWHFFVRAGGYYRIQFQGFRGVTQGETLYPTIFNMVVNTVVLHWVEYMVESAGKQGGRGKEGRHQNALF